MRAVATEQRGAQRAVGVAEARTRAPPVLELVRGYLRSFIRGRATDLEFNNLTAAAARGTEFVSAVDANGRVEITVFDGIVDLTNPQGAITITNGWQGASVAGSPPVLSPALNAANVIQWVLHYPGVLDVEEDGFGHG